MIDGDIPRKAVMSVGWNPFYKNTKRSAVNVVALTVTSQEIHIMHKFDADFYGTNIRMVVTSFLRPEQNFTYIAKIRPRIAFIMDIRRQAVLQHLMYKAVFQRTNDRVQFLAFLLSRPLPKEKAVTPNSPLSDILAYFSATPADFGSLLIQRRRWANGGLLILPKLLRYVWSAPKNLRLLQELFMRFNYLAMTTLSVAVLYLFAFYSFSPRLSTPLLIYANIPLLFLYARDLKVCGYRYSDVFRVMSLNLMLLPIITAGVLKQVQQILTGRAMKKM